MKLGITLSGPDMRVLARAVLASFPYTRDPPRRMLDGLREVPVPDNWEAYLLETEDAAAEWGTDQRIASREGSISVSFPEEYDQESVRMMLQFLAPLPFELAVFSVVADYWADHDYYAPAISADHALLGWGMIFKGAGHDHSIVSRRWLEHGPFRTLHGAEDTTLVQFHDPGADGSTSLAQAKPAHKWIVAGFLRPKHRYQHDIAGIYTKADGLLRIVINGRTVSNEELLDACAARRDRRDDPEKPIRNIAYIFVDEQEARAHLEALWLRGLECRVADGRGERRLDDAYQPAIAKPGWV